ncbi:tetratricopeptide repeat protein [Accumulibacter sp.]|uniref:tetratricopeptide repeat protein n=1 Tax=Accumulibacter sp. TaxID=2053492 RepID=UPI001AD58B3A|nr:tetratricopeptide repeat protein [Accumulibacter sp.]MBN8454662.1 tetratricopeptide repeat protein [Accumulibacter sp.]MBO3706033.1 tetratricopeptide repeat protein [Candidatus Accumulibacter conexus]
MIPEAQRRWEEVARRYDLPRQAEWQKLLNHFDLTEGFSLVIVLVADADGAALCKRELERVFGRESKQLLALDLPTTAALLELPGLLLAAKPLPETACLWIEAVDPDYSRTYAESRDAWRSAVARLNAFRNTLRKQFHTALTFVGAPWLQEVLREVAPDIWSVRTLVVRIEPQREAGRIEGAESSVRQVPRSDIGNTTEGGDPLFALKEAEKLRRIPGKELALAQLLQRAGEGFIARDQWRESAQALTEALALRERAGAPPRHLLETLNALAVASYSLGEVKRSISCSRRALVIGRDIGDRLAEGASLGNLGNAYAALGDARKAIEFHEQALVIDREIGDRRGEGADLANLGLAYGALGDAGRAIELYEQTLTIAREIGDRRGEGNTLGNLGNAYCSLGDARKAIELHEQALVIAREIGDRRVEGNALGNLGSAYYSLGDARKAIEFHEQALVIARDIEDRWGQANSLWNSALALDKSGERAQAIAHAEAALQIHEAIEDPKAANVRAQLAAWRAGS